MAKDHAITRLADYRPPFFRVESVHLHFELSARETLVQSTMRIRRVGKHNEALSLDGEDLQLLSIAIAGEALAEARYSIDEAGLKIYEVSDHFELSVSNRIAPADNTRLEGLYLSNGIYCTQCEAEGFRRITYFMDRPDVMARYDVQITAPAEFSVCLSNGNLLEDKIVGDKRICHWQDPYPKPCYLFALVAGNLSHISDNFVTHSGRSVRLNIYTPIGYENRADYAMQALKRAMRWDEVRFGLEYDLELFNIVAISDFNMGAMENKSLNIFNAKYILADAKTATDMDYAFIESVIGHEYFHNWSGNRVTCRDWFQLSLKEGLTVFRDQEFSADENSAAVRRVIDMMQLKHSQFPEDASKLSHPVRPREYIEINNFYTATVYEKGAEIVRMLQSMLGKLGFRRGLELYFARHDGQAVTCDDFLDAMRSANQVELANFEYWYSQSGTPRVRYCEFYDDVSRTYSLELEQETKPTADSEDKVALLLPLEFALLSSDGDKLPLNHGNHDSIMSVEGRDFLLLSQDKQQFTFSNIVFPHLSLNRGFSAPVIIETRQSSEKLAFHIRYDDDAAVRWQAMQDYSLRVLSDLIEDSSFSAVDNHSGYFNALAGVLERADEDYAFASLLLRLPSESYIGEQRLSIDVRAIHRARNSLKGLIAERFCEEFGDIYDSLRSEEPYVPEVSQMGRRALRNLALGYCSAGGGADGELASEHYYTADNMTDKVAAMEILVNSLSSHRDLVFRDFYDTFRCDDIVLDKWFSLQARSLADDCMAVVGSLSVHADFSIKNPNRLRALVGSFAFGNPLMFHSEDGRGYDFVLSILGQLDTLNPQVSARLLSSFSVCDRLVEPLRSLSRSKLLSFRDSVSLSKDSSEILGKILGDA